MRSAEPHILKLTWNQLRTGLVTEERRREIYSLTRFFEPAFLDGLLRGLRRQLAQQRLRRRPA